MAGKIGLRIANGITNASATMNGGTAMATLESTVSPRSNHEFGAHRSGDARRQSDGHHDQHRHERQREGHRKSFGDDLHHRLSAVERGPQVSGQRPTEPVEVPHDQRLVQPERLPGLFDLLGAGIVTGQRRRRIARNEIDERVDEEADEQQHRDRRGDPLCDQGHHQDSFAVPTIADAARPAPAWARLPRKCDRGSGIASSKVLV